MINLRHDPEEIIEEKNTTRVVVTYPGLTYPTILTVSENVSHCLPKELYHIAPYALEPHLNVGEVGKVLHETTHPSSYITKLLVVKFSEKRYAVIQAEGVKRTYDKPSIR